MAAKEYLSQAYRLDLRINSKIEQISSLSGLATKCTSVISDMPGNPNRATSAMADAVDKIIDLQSEINHDIDTLVNLKQEIVSVIKGIENLEYQTLLEKRYLCFLSWEKIAVAMGYDLRYLHKLHNRALQKCIIPAKIRSGH